MQTEPQSTATSTSTPAPASEPQSAAPEPNHTPLPAVTIEPNAPPREGLAELLNPTPPLGLATVTPTQPPTVVTAPACPIPNSALPAPHSSARRRGRIARLPKLQRDIVNRMLLNGVPYKNIVAALHEADFGFHITERNVSSWATGGYLEWRAHQDFVIDNRLDQDHMIDHLRTDDATQLTEVGLQAAATHLSQTFLQKLARSENIEANLGTYTQMADVLCRLNREIGILEKKRSDSRRTLGPAYDPDRVKNEEQKAALELERDFSNPDDPESGLENPAEPPFLPPYPMSSTLVIKDLEDKARRTRNDRETLRMFRQAVNGQKPTLPAGFELPAAPQPAAANGTSTAASSSLR